MKENRLSYVLITPARNEECFIEGVIRSVISQSVKPLRWVIVSDGSTDGTDAIIMHYSKLYGWIDFVRMPEHRDRQFAAKVHCFNAGCERLRGLLFDIIGNLDADITFGEDYIEFLLEKFNEEPMLGVAGTPFVENGMRSVGGNFVNLNHVSGACQLFRKSCFEQIGGYKPIKGGGIDWTAVTTARMKGWQTRTFTEKVCYHHRKMGTGNSGYLMSRFYHGQKDYYLGGHPLWELFRGFYRMGQKPYVVAGAYLLAGYFGSYFKKIERPIPKDVIEFHRAEQIQRLKELFIKRFVKKE
jgi:biofilm PGA synthesis N-glycosyltransferase PgaC